MSEQVALITGAGGGIGFGIAKSLARRGFAIALHDLKDSDAFQAKQHELEQLGAQTCRLTGDLRQTDQHASLLDEAEANLGPLTTLVSNAGVSVFQRTDVLDVKLDSFDHCMTSNARAPFHLLQCFSRRLIERQRDPELAYSIISVSSVNAVAASVNRAEYCMSKAAAAMMAKVFAARLAGEGIQVFDIQPGIIETDMTKPSMPTYQKKIDEEELTLIPRVGQPEEVGALCAAAASGDLPYLVGQVLRPDGGLLLERL